ncbi:interferon omega-1-like [Eptesicus fuscus]|uniref:interferon omega-1-like n=1 Tax=Eptesicus fuscus TaxID=29078 RepID=UPI00240448EB|nr:interferon omega-1-like [Eptesicus fuscus]
MAQIHLWLVAGAMLCSSPVSSLEDDLLWIHRGENLRVFNLLRQLQRTRPHLCLDDRNDFKFPWNGTTITQMQQTERTCLHHQMITHIVDLFRTQHSLDAWNHTLVSQLLSSLHHSLEHLEQREGENRDCSNLGILLRKYFQSIHNYLREKKYSACAWEVVRVEITLRVGIM